MKDMSRLIERVKGAKTIYDLVVNRRIRKDNDKRLQNLKNFYGPGKR